MRCGHTHSHHTHGHTHGHVRGLGSLGGTQLNVAGQRRPCHASGLSDIPVTVPPHATHARTHMPVRAGRTTTANQPPEARTACRCWTWCCRHRPWPWASWSQTCPSAPCRRTWLADARQLPSAAAARAPQASRLAAGGLQRGQPSDPRTLRTLRCAARLALWVACGPHAGPGSCTPPTAQHGERYECGCCHETAARRTARGTARPRACCTCQRWASPAPRASRTIGEACRCRQPAHVSPCERRACGAVVQPAPPHTHTPPSS